MNRTSDFLQTVLKASVCLFMLSGTQSLMANEELIANEDGEEYVENDSTARITRRVVLPKYEMKEISGVIYDAATNSPMGGVRVQALDDKRYTSMTDEDGSYSIKVPVFVTTLYVTAPEYNSVHVAIKGDKNQNVYLQTNHFKSFFGEGTSATMSKTATISESSAQTIETRSEERRVGKEC